MENATKSLFGESELLGQSDYYHEIAFFKPLFWEIFYRRFKLDKECKTQFYIANDTFHNYINQLRDCVKQGDFSEDFMNDIHDYKIIDYNKILSDDVWQIKKKIIDAIHTYIDSSQRIFNVQTGEGWSFF